MRPSEAWKLHRGTISRVIHEHNGVNPRVFGSSIRGEDTEKSDLDLLIDPTHLTTLFDIAEIERKLREIIGVRVEVKTPNSLSSRIRTRVLESAVPL